MQRMGGINAVALSKDQRYTITAGQDKKIVIWDNAKNDCLLARYIDGENDEGLSIAM